MVENITSKVDFHVHYDPLRPETGFDVIRKAEKCGIIAITLLDRNSISPMMAEYVEYGKDCGVEVIPGIEIVARFGMETVELIAMGFDVSDLGINKAWGGLENKVSNTQMVAKQISLFNNEGFSFNHLSQFGQENMDKLLLGEISEKAITLCQCIVTADDDENRRLLEELKESESQLWQKLVQQYSETDYYKGRLDRLNAKLLYEIYFGPGKKGRDLICTQVSEVVSIVHSAGGVVLYSPEGLFGQKIWDDLQEKGVDGIMAWHGGKLGRDKDVDSIPISIIKDAIRKGMLVLGGSDYDPKKNDWKLGVGGDETMYMSERRYQDLLGYKNRYNVRD